jgi:hypothetical protein
MYFFLLFVTVIPKLGLQRKKSKRSKFFIFFLFLFLLLRTQKQRLITQMLSTFDDIETSTQ